MEHNGNTPLVIVEKAPGVGIKRAQLLLPLRKYIPWKRPVRQFWGHRTPQHRHALSRARGGVEHPRCCSVPSLNHTACVFQRAELPESTYYPSKTLHLLFWVYRKIVWLFSFVGFFSGHLQAEYKHGRSDVLAGTTIRAFDKKHNGAKFKAWLRICQSDF